MHRLLVATFKQLFKNVWFYLGIMGMMLNSLFVILNNYNYRYLGNITPDNTLFSGDFLLNILSAVFVCMFIGMEYSNKTIRNKIIVGHSKKSVYLCNQIVCTVAVLIMHLSYFAVNATIGVWLLGAYQYPKYNTIYFFCSLATEIAKVSLLVWVAMSLTNRAVCLIIIVCIAYATPIMMDRLDYKLVFEPKMQEEYFWMEDEEGNMIEQMQLIQNPRYIKDDRVRAIGNFFSRFIPYGQNNYYTLDIILNASEFPKIAEREKHLKWLPIYALVFLSMTTAGGIISFKRKDLK